MSQHTNPVNPLGTSCNASVVGGDEADKSATIPSGQVSPCALCTVSAHARRKGSCVRSRLGVFCSGAALVGWAPMLDGLAKTDDLGHSPCPLTTHGKAASIQAVHWPSEEELPPHWTSSATLM